MAVISGTIPHNLLFSSNETEFLILNRTYRINVNQFPINELIGAKVIYIDCHYSFFPNSADIGPYLLGVNQHLLDSCTDNKREIPQGIQKELEN